MITRLILLAMLTASTVCASPNRAGLKSAWSGVYGRGVAGELWTPADLGTNGGMTAWWDASDTNELWQDMAATIPATDGTRLRRWGNKTLPAEWAAASNDDHRPTVKDGWIVFDGANVMVGAYNQVYLTTTNFYIFTASQITNATYNSAAVYLHDALYSCAAGYYGAYIRNTGVLLATTYDGNYDTITNAFTTNATFITYHQKTPTTSEFATDGATATSIESGTISGAFTTTIRFQIGAGYQTRYMQGRIGEVILGKTGISLANRQRMEGYLAHKWGLTANLPSGHPYKNKAPTK